MADLITTKKYQVNGITLNVAEVGQGKPLVLIHGWSNSWVGWTLLGKALAPFYKLYLIDLPGFGDSDRLANYSLELISGYVTAFITEQVGKTEAIIAASLGTIISSYTLEHNPHLTDNLILLGAIFQRLSIENAAQVIKKILSLSNQTAFTTEIYAKAIKFRYTAYLVEKFLNAYKFNKELVDKYSLPGRAKIDGKAYVQLGLSAAQFDLESYLRQTKLATLMIYGEADKYIKTADARKVMERIANPKVSLEILAECGHNPAYEQPQKTAALIRKFLNT